jgi:hypothetical protein
MSIRISHKQSYDLDGDQFFLSGPNNLKAAFKFLSQKDDKLLFFRYHMEPYHKNLIRPFLTYGDHIIIRQVYMISQKTPRHIKKYDFNELNNLYLFDVGTKELLCLLSGVIKQEEEEKSRQEEAKIPF